ncbi:MAG: 4-hydroxy-tetrahydrodipicolinate reductase [Fimbriimonadaceae bacterium]
MDQGSTLRVAVTGAAGRMGRETIRAILAASDLQLVAAVDRERVGESVDSVVGAPSDGVAIAAEWTAEAARTQPDVLVDFTHGSAAAAHARHALQSGIAPVVGATGLTDSEVAELEALSRQLDVPGMLVPNFAIGAVLMMEFARMAARWMPHAEIVELHHDQKRDAPSGTACRTAEKIARGRAQSVSPQVPELVRAEGARGGVVADVAVHSVRLPGLLAHQMVVFGGTGECLTVRHDSMDRSSFMPGVLLAIRRVRTLTGWHEGLEGLLFWER